MDKNNICKILFPIFCTLVVKSLHMTGISTLCRGRETCRCNCYVKVEVIFIYSSSDGSWRWWNSIWKEESCGLDLCRLKYLTSLPLVLGNMFSSSSAIFISSALESSIFTASPLSSLDFKVEITFSMRRFTSAREMFIPCLVARINISLSAYA